MIAVTLVAIGSATTGVAAAATTPSATLPPTTVPHLGHDLATAPHLTRVRPVLGSVAATPRRSTRAEKKAAAAAIVACDPANAATMAAAPTVTAKTDTAIACVLAADPKGRKGERELLGPAGLIGTDLDDVRVIGRRGKQTPHIVADASAGRSNMLDAFASSHFHQPAVLTVDGNVVGATTILQQAAAPQSYGGSMQFDMMRRPSSDQARQLVRDVDTSRAETLRAAADQATFTAAGRALLEQHDVTVDDKQRFASSCNVAAEENSLVFGCFEHGHIHVLRVDRTDVGSLMSVSLAHEMLHAVYASLSPSERKRIDAMVQAAYQQYGDQHLRGLIAEYEKVEPGSTANELHSLLPTEIGTLPPALERYYAKWFTNRQQIVANYKVLDDNLSALEDRVSQLDTQVTGLDAQLKSIDGQINDAGQRADSLGAQIDSLREQGRIDESNNLVDPQNAAADEANALVDQYNAMVDQYNALIDQYNQLTANYRELYDSISAVPFAEPHT